MTSLLPSLRSSGQEYFPFFSIHSCPHVHVSYFSQLGFPSLSLGSPSTPLLLCLRVFASEKTWLWLMPSCYLVHGCTWVAQPSWRKYTIGPADLILESGPQISNECSSTWYFYCISVLGNAFFFFKLLNTFIKSILFTSGSLPVEELSLYFIKETKSVG